MCMMWMKKDMQVFMLCCKFFYYYYKKKRILRCYRMIVDCGIRFCVWGESRRWWFLCWNIRRIFMIFFKIWYDVINTKYKRKTNKCISFLHIVICILWLKGYWSIIVSCMIKTCLIYCVVLSNRMKSVWIRMAREFFLKTCYPLYVIT